MLSLLLAATAGGTCPIERANYIVQGYPAFTAYFRPIDSGNDWPSHIVLVVHDAKTGKSTWWLPWQGGTDGKTNIASTNDVTSRGWKPPNPDGGPRPQGDRELLTTDLNYHISDSVPERGDQAPAHMLVPDAGSAHDNIFPVRQFFDRVGCSKAAR